jgi:LysR family transcriptional regulator, hydrogen peroxide-inducible genes activator
MEMQQLRYVVAVARTGNFSRAAESCHVSQPSLSQQIQKLEEELGGRLFDRMKRETVLTAVGQDFLTRAVRILAEADAAQREVRECQGLLRGVLSVGVLPTIAPYLLPGMIQRFAAKYPGVELVVHEDTTARLAAMLLGFEIDLGLASLPLEDDRLEIVPLFTEELLLALPPGHALSAKKSVSLPDLEQERLIVMKEGHCLGDQVSQFCAASGTRPQVSFRSAQLETIQALVRTGFGLSLIPAMAAYQDRAEGPVYRSFDAPRPTRDIVAVWPKLRPPGRAAIEFLKLRTTEKSAPELRTTGRT